MHTNGDSSTNRSLGLLRKNRKTKPRSPDLTGKITLRIETLKNIAEVFQRTHGDTVECQLAAWGNIDKHGEQYLTVQFSPPYVRQQREPEPGLKFDWSDFLQSEPEDCE